MLISYSPKWCLFPTHLNDAYFLLTKMMLISYDHLKMMLISYYDHLIDPTHLNDAYFLISYSPKWCLFPNHQNDAYFLWCIFPSINDAYFLIT